jgi:TolB-like protein
MNRKQNKVTVTATMPVSAKLTGTMKRPNNVTDRRNGLRDRRHQRTWLHISALFALSLMLVFVGGCATNTSMQYVRQNIDYSDFKRIAVLPFESLTTDEYAGEKIRKTVITELLSKGVDVVEPGEVTRVLIEQKIKSLGSVRTTDLQNVAKTLGVGALMMGSVEAYGISRGISVSYPEVSINLRLVEASSGNIVWSVCQTSGGPSFWTRHFGAEGASLSDTANEVVQEAIDTLF